MAEARNEGPVRPIIETGDGSNTLFHPEVGEHYHSKHGALQESKHVFLQSGAKHFLDLTDSTSLHILEVGFGTGLNYLVTADFCSRESINLHYTGIERYPLSKELITETNHVQHVSSALADEFLQNYEQAQHKRIKTRQGSWYIDVCDVNQFQMDQQADVLYFDAFAAIHQPEMWSAETLGHVCSFLKSGGIFVTYAITGNLKRTMKSLGFLIEKAPGAPGKREMLRATKI